MSGPSNVLIVDDDEDLRGILALHLSSRGYHVLEAADGQSALDLVRANGALSLLVLDLRMPGMSGHDVIRELRADGNEVPIIVLSGDREAGRRALTAGAHAFLLKPVDSTALLASVRAHERAH